VTVIATVLAIVTGIGASVSFLGPEQGQLREEGTYTDSRFGWSIDIPAGMFLRPFDDDVIRARAIGAMVSSFNSSPSSVENGTPNMTGLRGFPADGVALQIWHLDASLPVVFTPLHSARLPLDPETFHQVGHFAGGSEPTPQYRGFIANGIGFSAAMWFGPEASAPSRDAIRSILASLRFPPLRTDTIWQNRFYVLGSVYGLGPVRRIPASRIPSTDRLGKPHSFFLVNAPRGFYQVQAIAFPHGERCRVRFDPRTSRFLCREQHVAWNRLGAPLGELRGRRDAAIGPRAATISLDGQVLVNPWGRGIDIRPVHYWRSDEDLGPCSLLRRGEVAHLTESRVHAVRNVPSIDHSTRLCAYRSDGRFGWITAYVTASPPARLTRLFRHPDENTTPIAHLGDAAYAYAGVDVAVRVGETYFRLSTQKYQPDGIGVLRGLARVALARLSTTH
jgi:hypothetical protein